MTTKRAKIFYLDRRILAKAIKKTTEFSLNRSNKKFVEPLMWSC